MAVVNAKTEQQLLDAVTNIGLLVMCAVDQVLVARGQLALTDKEVREVGRIVGKIVAAAVVQVESSGGV